MSFQSRKLKSPLTHELFYIGLFNFFSLKFVACKCYCKK